MWWHVTTKRSCNVSQIIYRGCVCINMLKYTIAYPMLKDGSRFQILYWYWTSCISNRVGQPKSKFFFLLKIEWHRMVIFVENKHALVLIDQTSFWSAHPHGCFLNLQCQIFIIVHQHILYLYMCDLVNCVQKSKWNICYKNTSYALLRFLKWVKFHFELFRPI